MVLKDIMSISGQSGLFRFIAQGKNSIIVEHLETKQRSSAFSTARVSSLEEISVFTEKEDMPLGEVFDRIQNKVKGDSAPDYRSDPELLKKFFQEVIPEYDRDRVYISDLKKIVQWYNILLSQNLLISEENGKRNENEDNPETGDDVTPQKEPKPAKKKASKTKNN